MPAAPAFDLFAPGSAAVLVLVAIRLTGLILIAPVFSARTIPARIRTAILLVLTVLLQPAALGAVPNLAAVALTPQACAGELLVGFALGMSAALFVGGAEVAGELMSAQIGLSGAAIFDPLSGGQTSALGQFTSLFAVTLLLALNAHLVMLDAIAESFHRLPVGGALHLADACRLLVREASVLFVLGVRFAAPIIGVIILANAALAVLGRAVPQLNVLSVAFPVQIGLGLLTLAAVIPFMAFVITGWGGEYHGQVGRLLGVLARGVR